MSTNNFTLVSGHVSNVYNKVQDSQSVAIKVIGTNYDATFPAVFNYTNVSVECLSTEGYLLLVYLDFAQQSYTKRYVICEDDNNIHFDI